VHADLIHQAASLLQSGDRVSARLLLEEALYLAPRDEQAWLWLSGAVETEHEQLDCLRQVLAIDPDNQAAQAGIKSLITALDPAEASLETFLQEQESSLSISPNPVVKKEAKKAHFVGESAPLSFSKREAGLSPIVNSPDHGLDDLRGVSEPSGRSWGRPVTLAALVSPERSGGLSGLLLRGDPGKSSWSIKFKLPPIPWKQFPFTSEQVMYFILGLIITFLVLLIGFSGLKTVLHGPRYMAAAPALPTPLPPPTPLPEPAPLVFTSNKVASDCRFTIPPDAPVECFTMILPETRDGTSARSIRVPLVIYRSLNPFPPPDPIVYLHGGSFGSAIDWASANYENFILPLLYQRDVIVLEQRGAGQSTPNLDCPEFDNQYFMDLRNDPEDPGRGRAFASALQACRDRLTSQGIRFSSFTTSAFAADVADIAAVLGIEQINLYGIAYGASVAQVVMRDNPHLVRSAVLDSAFPLEVKAYNSIAASTDYALRRLFETCAAQSACRSAYPNLEAVFYEVIKKLEDKPIIVPSASPGSSTGTKMIVDGVRFQQAVVQALFSNDLLPDIPKGIYSARYGDTAFLEAALSNPEGHFFNPSSGSRLSTHCPEQVYATTPAELEVDLDAFPASASLARYSIFGSAESLFGICDLWKTGPFDAGFKAPLSGGSPTLIFAGGLDPIAPAYLGEQLASHLDRATLIEFPNLGHAVSTAGLDCPLSLASIFLFEPDSELDPACGVGIEPGFIVR
jgi:pimeloyl-ACP methyl ester carboxylesterase